MKKKAELTEWIKFGAIISVIIFALAYGIGFFLLVPFFGASIVTANIGLALLPLIFISIILGAIKFGLLGLIYNSFLHKFLDSKPVFWQLTGLIFLVDFSFDLFLGTTIDLWYFLVSVLSIMFSVWIILFIAKTIKLKVPVRGNK